MMVAPNIPNGRRPKQPFRRTRNSNVAGDLRPPYTVARISASSGGVGHRFAKPEGGAEWVSCCGLRHPELKTRDVDISCMTCVTCKGCWVCTPDWIGEETMFMGKWETKDGRRLYPFEMDSIHLVNSIKKLKRDEEHFKDNWQDWVKCLEAEARLRKVPYE